MEKKTSSANRLVLKRILGQPGNGRCADCKTATHPRWASWNIGILICIRCSGIHRSLGTHISKVRSIDLDTWNETQLEKLVEFGNTRANAYWEAKLPPNYVPDESKIVSFIKTKYELRRWIRDDDDEPLAKTAAAAPRVPPRLREAPKTSVDLLDLDGAFNMNKASRAEAITTTQSSGMPSQTSAHAPQQYMQQHRTFKQPQTAQNRALPETPVASAGSQNRTDVKKSILSLYSQPSRQPTPSHSPFTPSPAPTPPPAASVFSAAPGSLAASAPPLQSSSSSSVFGAEAADDEEDNFAHVWK